jgi:hypothetical protein
VARTALVVTDISRAVNAGTLTAGDDVNEHDFVNDGRTIICALNTGTAATLTFLTPGTVGGLAIADLAVSVPIHATKVALIGPFPPGIYNQSDGKVYVDVDDDTNLSLGAFRLPA